MEGSAILRSVVNAAMARIERSKIAGPHEIVVELVATLEDFEIEVTITTQHTKKY